MAVAIILAQSRRQAQSSSLLRAADRYQGIYFKILYKYIREGKLRDADIFVLTERHGVIGLQDFVPYTQPSKHVARGNIDKIIERNLETLKRQLSKRKYSEVYVNCGKDFLRLINGFEKLTSAKVTFAEGLGLGPKAAHMKKWIIQSSNATNPQSTK